MLCCRSKEPIDLLPILRRSSTRYMENLKLSANASPLVALTQPRQTPTISPADIKNLVILQKMTSTFIAKLRKSVSMESEFIRNYRIGHSQDSSDIQEDNDNDLRKTFLTPEPSSGLNPMFLCPPKLQINPRTPNNNVLVVDKGFSQWDSDSDDDHEILTPVLPLIMKNTCKKYAKPKIALRKLSSVKDQLKEWSKMSHAINDLLNAKSPPKNDSIKIEDCGKRVINAREEAKKIKLVRPKYVKNNTKIKLYHRRVKLLSTNDSYDA